MAEVEVSKSSPTLSSPERMPSNYVTSFVAALRGSLDLPASILRFGAGYLIQPVEALHIFSPAFFGSTFDPDRDIEDLAGKVILVTGGNNGIGKETVLQLAKHKPSKIYLTARSESKGRDAIASIKEAISLPSAAIEHLPLDLSSFKSIHNAAGILNDSTDRLDICIYNAGCLSSESSRTDEGLEIHLGTNHVGHHLLTKLLLPLLEKTAAESDSDIRVISISSLANVRSPPLATVMDIEKLSKEDMIVRYAASKAANIYFAAELARRHPTLTSISLHPGMINSDIYNAPQEQSLLFRAGYAMAAPFLFLSQQRGAHTQLWAAASARKADLQNGGYYSPVGILRDDEGNRKARDQGSCAALWEWTEAEIAKQNKIEAT